MAQALKENGVAVQGVDVASNAKDARLSAPDSPEIRFLKSMDEDPLLSGLVETFRKNTGKEPKLVGTSNPADLDPGTYEIRFSKH